MTKIGKRLIAAAKEVRAIARGELEPAYVHVESDVNVKAIRRQLSMTQSEFAGEFLFSLDQIRHWEQNRSRPQGGARAYLILIQQNPKAVQQMLQSIKQSQRRAA